MYSMYKKKMDAKIKDQYILNSSAALTCTIFKGHSATYRLFYECNVYVEEDEKYKWIVR